MLAIGGVFNYLKVKNLDPLFSVLTLESNLYGETAFEKVCVHPMSIWWSIGGSNP